MPTYRKKSGSGYPYTHKPFDISEDNPLRIDYINNPFGDEVVPDITPVWIDKEMEVHHEGDEYGDLVVLVDDSGSMPNPLYEESPAVIGALVLARQAIEYGMSVAYGRFGDRTTIKDYTNDLDKIVDELIKYKNGSYTEIDINLLKKYVEKTPTPKKVVLITDGGFNTGYTYQEVIRELNRMSNVEAYIFNINMTGFEKIGNVSIYGISNPQDINKIVLGRR